MAADGLTKRMISYQIMTLITSGYLLMKTNKPVLVRQRPRTLSYTERDLEEMKE